MSSHSATQHNKRNEVVLGVSSSMSGSAALHLAVREASARGVPLRLVQIWQELGWEPSMTLDGVPAVQASERQASADLDAAVVAARALDPTVIAIPDFEGGDLYELLRERSAVAGLLVLGAGHERPRSGSIDAWFAERAGCPVVAVSSTGDVLRGQSNLHHGSARPETAVF